MRESQRVSLRLQWPALALDVSGEGEAHRVVPAHARREARACSGALPSPPPRKPAAATACSPLASCADVNETQPPRETAAAPASDPGACRLAVLQRCASKRPQHKQPPSARRMTQRITGVTRASLRVRDDDGGDLVGTERDGAQKQEVGSQLGADAHRYERRTGAKDLCDILALNAHFLQEEINLTNKGLVHDQRKIVNENVLANTEGLRLRSTRSASSCGLLEIILLICSCPTLHSRRNPITEAAFF